jgi:hypothetical protein
MPVQTLARPQLLSQISAFLDLLQMGTGGGLILFMWSHLVLVIKGIYFGNLLY